MVSMSRDAEHTNRGQEYPNGFSSVAAFIAEDPDNTSTIYRRFDRLAARNLLYLQARLQKLEAVQDKLDNENLLNGDLEASKAASSWEDFEALAITSEREKKRMEMADQIQVTLKAYRRLPRSSWLVALLTVC